MRDRTRSPSRPGPRPLGGVRPSVEFDGQVLSVLAEELAVVVVDGPEGGEVARLHAAEEVLPPAPLQVHQALEAQPGVGLHQLHAVRHVRLVEDPSGERGTVRGRVRGLKGDNKLWKEHVLNVWSGTSPGLQPGGVLQRLLAQLLPLVHVEEAPDQNLQLVPPLLRQPVPRGEQSPSGRPHPPSVRVLQQADPLLAALRGGELLGQLLLQEAVVHVGGGVAAGAEQQDVVGVVVLHLGGEVSPVLVGNDVFPV